MRSFTVRGAVLGDALTAPGQLQARPQPFYAGDWYLADGAPDQCLKRPVIFTVDPEEHSLKIKRRTAAGEELLSHHSAYIVSERDILIFSSNMLAALPPGPAITVKLWLTDAGNLCFGDPGSDGGERDFQLFRPCKAGKGN